MKEDGGHLFRHFFAIVDYFALRQKQITKTAGFFNFETEK